MASADFSEDSEEKRPTVQVGDPFTEKLLIEACLELMASDAIVAIQDMGAAGLTSSSVEMASKGGVGLELDMNAVPCREEGMTPYEMMLSESQERMLMVLKPGREGEAEAIFRKWELDFAVIGRVTDTGNLVLKWNGEIAADIPLAPLADDAPCYDRPWVPTPKPAPLTDVPESTDIAADLLKLMASPDLASRRWIWEQYDHMVGADTVQRPGGDAAVVRVHGTDKALAITCDVTPRYCHADPVEGGKQAIAEAWRNLCAVGATPLAATDCMNFGNPQRPEIMGQFVGCIEGIAEACRALDFPIVSGNVSLYNETKNEDGTGSAILPTPAIGGVGLLQDWRKSATIGFKAERHDILLVGALRNDFGQSLWLREIHGREDGPPPAVDLEEERANGEFVRACIEKSYVSAVHDVADGGLAVAIAEMALAGNIGAELAQDIGPDDLPTPHQLWFAESQGVYVVAARHGLDVIEAAKAAGRPCRILGKTGGTTIRFLEIGAYHFELGTQDDLQPGATEVAVSDLRRAHEGFFPSLMGGEIIVA
jgi:phosphoribosylformylglycinamidine synthase